MLNNSVVLAIPSANVELNSISKDALYNYAVSLKVSFTYYKLFCTARQKPGKSGTFNPPQPEKDQT